MIKILRDNFPPVDTYLIGRYKKISKWRVFENRVITAFRNTPNLFVDGLYNFRTHPSYNIWRDEIIKYQGRKCCYCEKPIANGSLDHYRPKKGWQQNQGDALNRPGYYWLAYRWSNLLLSCSECNDQSQKGNLFPIDNIRAINQSSNLNDEQAILINPYYENPNTYISFYKSKPISLHPRGHQTIEILKLRTRPDISETRNDSYNNYKIALKIASLPAPVGSISQDDIEQAKERIRIKVKKKEPFSGMILENLRNNTFDL
jgi:uncharacterized protein (TIGR02646 family)